MPSNGPLVTSIIAFYIFSTFNLSAALYAPIQDCDETYNYFEPTHYLNYGYGRQTWEYSPMYGLRSWLYICLHAIPGKLGSFFSSTKTFEFYFIRSILAVTCAFSQSRLFTSVSKALNPRIGAIFMVIMISSPGMFHASAAYLPSSFALYTAMLGTANSLEWRGSSKIHVTLMFFGIGGIIGWPFSAALVAPFIIEEWVLAAITHELIEFSRRLIDGTVRCTIVLVSNVKHSALFAQKTHSA